MVRTPSIRFYRVGYKMILHRFLVVFSFVTLIGKSSGGFLGPQIPQLNPTDVQNSMFLSKIKPAPLTLVGITAEEEIAKAMEKKEGYEKFKSTVLPKIKAEWMKKDVMLVKFFNAAQRDATAAIFLVETKLGFRKQNNIDGILKEDMSEALASFGNAGNKGKDKSGRIVSYINFGAWRLSEAIKNKKGATYERVLQYLGEFMAEEIVKEYEAGGKYSRAVGIVDFEKWQMADGMCAECTPLMIRASQVFDGKYVSQAHRWVCINVPMDFHLFLNLIRVMLSKETNEILLEYGRDKSKWKPELQKVIDPDTLREMMFYKEEYDNEKEGAAGKKLSGLLGPK